MTAAVDRYLALRRAAGFHLANSEYLLRSFARFGAARGETHVRTATAIEWASQSPSVAQRDTRFKTVCRFARDMHAEDDRHDVLPRDHFGYRKTRRMPYIYSSVEIHRLMQAAGHLGPPASWRSQTYATLIGLLAATGLRVGEALALQVSDVTPNGLLIRHAKFQKTRLVPLHSTTDASLQRYLTRRREAPVRGSHVFITDEGQPLPYWDVHRTFRTLLKTAGLGLARGRRPCLHALRHTFAVRALEGSPAGRRRVDQHMVALATYMGHVNINATYWYLEITPELLRDVARVSETFLYGEPS
jgi:integrase/recombinase XerD